MDKHFCDLLDKKANGADEVALNGKKYVRSGPKNSTSDPKQQLTFRREANDHRKVQEQGS